MPMPSMGVEAGPREPAVFLVGFMGCGKSSLGRALAEALGYRFCDLDERLEAELGTSIASLFSAGREAEFRARETALIEELSQENRLVVATGGGACTAPRARAALRRGGRVLWLHAELPALLARLGDDPRRPMLRGDVATLYQSRQAQYADCADSCIDADQPLERVLDQALRSLRPS